MPWPKFRIFGSKLRVLTKISSFDQNLEFWPKFGVFTKISIFAQNFEFWPTFRVLTKVSCFDQKFQIAIFTGFCWKKYFYRFWWSIKKRFLGKFFNNVFKVHIVFRNVISILSILAIIIFIFYSILR